MQTQFGNFPSSLMMMSRKNKKSLMIVIVSIILCCAGVARADTIGQVLATKECNIEYGIPLSIQIFTFAQKMYGCNFLDIESLVKFDYSNQVGILNALEKTTALEIEKAFSTSAEKLDLEYGFVGLTEYYLYTKYAEQNSTCGDSDTLRRLGSSYNECKLCQGNYFSTKNAEQIKLLKAIDTLDYDNENNLFTSNSSISLNSIIVESFQLLWNCNNPDDQLIVTGYFDETTEGKLSKTDTDGFDKVCMMCQVKNCGACTSNYAQCLSCKEGFYMQDGICNQCTSQNCAKCTKNNDASTTCNLCRAGFLLLENQCVETCPPEYKPTKTQCLICRPGTYIKDETCEECSPFCRECSGPNASQCKECFDGFVYELGNGCSICPQGQQCGKERCMPTQYRQLSYPYKCDNCFQNCETCKGPLQNDCLTCKNNYSNVNGFCLNPSFKAKTFTDSRTKTLKECNFSCDECIDSTDLCTKCNTELNYFVKEGDRFKCYNRCPLFYMVKDANLNSEGYVECVKSQDFTNDLQSAESLRTQAKTRCPKQSFFNTQSNDCQKCTNNCISCNDGSSCIQCEPGYYFNTKRSTCSPCNSSCKNCTGPLYKDCVTCSSNSSKIYPDQQGVCNPSMNITPIETNILSQKSLYEDLKICKVFLPSDKQLYSAQFAIKFSSSDSNWANTEMMTSNKPCTFTEFQKRYKSISKNNRVCNDNDISQSTIGKRGDIVTIYSILLANSGAKINGQLVNPNSLTDYALKNNLFYSNYIYNPTLEFSCSQLLCNSQIDSYIDSLSSQNANKVISIKKAKDFVITTASRTPLQCFGDSQLIDENTVDQIEKTLIYAQATLSSSSSSSKSYFVLFVCGQDTQGKLVQKTLLVQKYKGNSFFEALNVGENLSSQVENISLYGASAEQNAYLKKCDSSLSNSFSSYVVQKVRVIQTEESDSNIDKSEERFQQYNDHANIQPINISKCTCPSTSDYIFSNENQGTQFITVITPQNKLISGSINAYEIKHILTAHSLDVDEMKLHNLSITKIEAESIYKEYIDETIQNAKTCFNFTDSTPQCIKNILADIIFSSRQNCINSKEISAFIATSNFTDLKDFIQKSSWCTLYSQRCLKSIQVIKGCI